MSVSAITERREQRAAIIQKMRALVDKADEEKRDLTGEESQEWDRLDKDADGILADIERRERLEQIKPAGLSPDTTSETKVPESRAVPASLAAYNAQRHGVAAQDTDEYRAAFYRLVTQGMQALEGDERRTLSRATNGAGGYLVPTTFERQIIDLMRDYGVMRQIANVITTQDGAPLQMATVAAHGAAAWTAENAAFTPSDETFGTASMSAYKAATIVLASEELLQDAVINLDAYLTNEIALRIGVLENTGYVVGDGTGKPTGITTQTTTGKTGANGQTTSVTSDDIIDLIYSVMGAFRRSGKFLMNEATAKSLMKIKDTTGQYIWSPGMTAGAPNTLFGYPVFTDPDMPVMAANAKSILFGDFSYYRIRDVQGIAIQRLNELYAANGQVGFRAWHRTDGRLLSTQAVKHYANSAT